MGVPVAFENKAGIKFVLAPAGEFLMGSAEDEPGRYPPEGPQHKVTIRKPFYVAIHPLRGGGSHSGDRRVRSASRHSYRQSHSSNYVGFRICCDLF